MVTQEMMRAANQERMAEIARLQLEAEAEGYQEKDTSGRSTRPERGGWLRLPSFVAHAFRLASP